jgi:hypothetical protein
MFICLYEVSLVFPLPPQGCVYILQTSLLIIFNVYLAPAVLLRDNISIEPFFLCSLIF